MAPPKLKERGVRVPRTQAVPRKSNPPAKPAAPQKKHHPVQPSTPPPKHKASKQSKVTKSKKKVTFSPLPSPKRQRRSHKLKITPSHSLALEFADAATTYRDTCTASLTSALNEVDADLKSHLNSITSNHADTLLKHDEKIQRQGLLIPLADDRLEVTTTINGVSTKTHHALGDSMSAFVATVTAEEHNLRELLKQWGVIQQSIVTLVEQVVESSGRAGDAGEGSMMAEEERGTTSSGYKREMEELEYELKRKVERVVEEVGYQGETLIEQLESDEAAEKAREAQQQQAFMLLIQ